MSRNYYYYESNYGYYAHSFLYLRSPFSWKRIAVMRIIYSKNIYESNYGYYAHSFLKNRSILFPKLFASAKLFSESFGGSEFFSFFLGSFEIIVYICSVASRMVMCHCLTSVHIHLFFSVKLISKWVHKQCKNE